MTQVRHLCPAIGCSYVLVATIGAFFGYVSSAYRTDTIGRRRHFILFSVCGFVIVAVYTQVPSPDLVMLFLGFPLGFFTVGIYGALGPCYVIAAGRRRTVAAGARPGEPRRCARPPHRLADHAIGVPGLSDRNHRPRHCRLRQAAVVQGLGMTEARFRLASSLFFIGYLVFEVTSALAVHRYGARLWLARCGMSGMPCARPGSSPHWGWCRCLAGIGLIAWAMLDASPPTKRWSPA